MQKPDPPFLFTHDSTLRLRSPETRSRPGDIRFRDEIHGYEYILPGSSDPQHLSRFRKAVSHSLDVLHELSSQFEDQLVKFNKRQQRQGACVSNGTTFQNPSKSS